MLMTVIDKPIKDQVAIVRIGSGASIIASKRAKINPTKLKVMKSFILSFRKVYTIITSKIILSMTQKKKASSKK